MLQNYFKTAWRTMKKNRIYSSINLIGLTIGICACMIVATVVIDDLSYDTQWSRKNDLYRIVTVNKQGEGLYDRFTSSFTGLSNKLRTDFPEVEAVGILHNYEGRLKFEHGDPNGINVSILNADTSLWKLLDLHVVSGNPRQYAEGENNIIITESFRKTYFANENPVGEHIYSVPTFSDKPTPYLITGVVDDIPSNSVFRSQVILVTKGRDDLLSKDQSGSYSPNNYILTKPGTDISAFETKLNKWYAGYVTRKNPYSYEFQPLKDVYLHSDFSENQHVQGDYRNIYILSGVALLLLLIACTNFVNLAMARSIQRLAETSVKKILGANKRYIIYQYLMEAFLFFLISTLVATLIYRLALPFVEAYIGHSLVKTFLSGGQLFLMAYGSIFLLSFLTGLYPAWIMSGFKPLSALKGSIFANRTGGQHLLRKTLVVVQFSISIIVLIALIVVKQQVSYMKTKDIGFNKQGLLNIGYVSWNKKGGAFKDQLLAQAGVSGASITQWTPTSAGYMTREIDDPNHPGNKLTVWYISGDIDLPRTLGLHLKEGRFFDNSFANDKMNSDSLIQLDQAGYEKTFSAQSSIITDYTARLLHASQLNIPIKGVYTTPVGIVSDFNSESLRKAMQPTVIIAEKSSEYGGMLVRVQTGHEQQVMTAIHALWRKFYPEKLLEIQWVEAMLDKQYKSEVKLMELFTFFSSLSMLLAALGIFGLIVQVTAQRVKEIGIRKVLGASVPGIVRLFSVDFAKLVLIAILVASPLAWWLMKKWLENFAYRVSVYWWVFAFAGLTAMLIAICTISIQAIKAALANPVKSLRTE